MIERESKLVACAAARKCPFCEAPAGLLYTGMRMGNPALLQELGLDIQRPSLSRWRVCDECGSDYAGSKEMDYSVEQSRKAYADVGSVRFPLPSEIGEQKSFLQYCQERLAPWVLDQSPLLVKTADGYAWRAEQATTT